MNITEILYNMISKYAIMHYDELYASNYSYGLTVHGGNIHNTALSKNEHYYFKDTWRNLDFIDDLFKIKNIELSEIKIEDLKNEARHVQMFIQPNNMPSNIATKRINDYVFVFIEPTRNPVWKEGKFQNLIL